MKKTVISILEFLGWKEWCRIRSTLKSVKEINRLVSKGISNIYLNNSLRKTDPLKYFYFDWFDASKKIVKNFSAILNSNSDHWTLNVLVATKKSEVWERKLAWLFYYFEYDVLNGVLNMAFWNYDVLKSKSLCFLLNKNVNFKVAWKGELRDIAFTFVLVFMIIILYSWQKVSNPLCFMKTTLYLPTPCFLKFVQHPQPPSSLVFLLPCFFGWMGDHVIFDVLFYLMILRIYPCQALVR